MDTIQTTAVVISHETALRAIRVARRRYSMLPWRPLSSSEQRRVLAACAPNRTSIDMGALYRAGLWNHHETDYRIDVLTLNAAQKRSHPQVRCHSITQKLPAGSLLEIEPGIYCVSPALAVTQYAAKHSLGKTVALLQELCGGFSLHEDQDAGQESSAGEEDIGYYESDPATCAGELCKHIAKLSHVQGYRQASIAVRFALDGARSPGEAIMVSMFHMSFCYGGFNISNLLLNHKIDFSHIARAASRMPYAICDAYVPDSQTTLEYNGSYHDQAAARIHDERRNAGLEAMGVTTLVINREQLRDIEALESIAKVLYRRAGKRYQNRTTGRYVKQINLLNELRAAFGWPKC